MRAQRHYFMYFGLDKGNQDPRKVACQRSGADLTPSLPRKDLTPLIGVDGGKVLPRAWMGMADGAIAGWRIRSR